MLEWSLLALMGLFAGTYGTIVGAGGGFIVGPLFLLVFDIEPRMAVGTTLALVLLNSIFGTMAYSRQRRIDFRSGILFGLAASPGSVIGALALVAAPDGVFHIAFGLLLLLVAAFLVLRPPLENRPAMQLTGGTRLVARRRIVTAEGHTYDYQYRHPGAVALNVVLGFISSFFGIGGGFLRAPALVYAFHFPVEIATATSIFTLSIYTAVGSATHLTLGHVSFFPLLVFTGLGVIAGSQVGAALSTRLSGTWTLRFLALALAALGAQLVLQGVPG